VVTALVGLVAEGLARINCGGSVVVAVKRSAGGPLVVPAAQVSLNAKVFCEEMERAKLARRHHTGLLDHEVHLAAGERQRTGRISRPRGRWE
jgi:hypothetical protein